MCQVPVAFRETWGTEVMNGPSFTNCSVDMFGPFLIKYGRKEYKRYCALFTLFNSRAVHTESICSMNVDSFIQALRRFIARRRNIMILYSDKRSDFVRAQRELENAFKKMYRLKIQYFLQNIDAYCITWYRNPPATWGEFGRGRYGQHEI